MVGFSAADEIGRLDQLKKSGTSLPRNVHVFAPTSFSNSSTAPVRLLDVSRGRRKRHDGMDETRDHVPFGKPNSQLPKAIHSVQIHRIVEAVGWRWDRRPP